MNALFELGPVYDPHVKSIMNLLLSKLKNNHPKPEGKLYAKNAAFVESLYNGKFLNKHFNTSRKEYNYENSYEIIRSCKGNWTKVRDLVATVLGNIELAKDKTYLPFNKRYVEQITFATFFEHFDANATEPGTNSNFLNFVNPPFKSRDYTSAMLAKKIKEKCPPAIRSSAERICNSRFKEGGDSLKFWRNISDFATWLAAFKEAYPEMHSEFALNCLNGNPLDDFEDYLDKRMRAKYGANYSLPTFHFQLSLAGSERLGLDFLDWLNKGISSGRFAMLRDLPKPIDFYRFPDSFKPSKETNTFGKKEKEVVDADEIIF